MEEESVGVCQDVSGSRRALQVDIPPVAIHSMTGGELTTGRACGWVRSGITALQMAQLEKGKEEYLKDHDT